MSGGQLQLHLSSAPGSSSGGAVPSFSIEVLRSARRKRSVGAVLRNRVLTVTVPSWMNAEQQASAVADMARRFERKASTERIDLAERAATLSRRYDLPCPNVIRWSDDMTSRWGSCTPSTSTVRIAEQVARFPDWVLDYVIVHEIAHLRCTGHGRDFWELVHRYPRAERAIGYLIARSHDDGGL